MGETTKIEWVDRSASPWHGCSRVHAGCDNCYAEAMAVRNPKTLGTWGENGTRVKSKSFVANLRKWNREAEARGEPISVFPSICDPFEDRPELVEWRNEMFSTIDQCPWIRLLLLTKRPENVRRMWPVSERSGIAANGARYWSREHFRPNVWLLTSVSDQPTADAMIPPLLKCRDLVPVLGVSAEPLLGPVDLARWLRPVPDCTFADGQDGCCSHPGNPTPECGTGAACPLSEYRGLNWVIVGGESGHGARPCDLAWIRSIVSQCKAAGVACFVKQLGASICERYPSAWPNGYPHGDQSVTLTGDGYGTFSVTGLHDKKGGDWTEWPADLRVREWPEVAQ